MRILILSSLLLLISISCSNKKIKAEVNKEIASATNIESENDLYLTEKENLKSNTLLRYEQRTKLIHLLDKMIEENTIINKQIINTKAVLFNTLINDKKSKIKVGIIEKQLTKLNKKKSRNTQSAYREAKNILGKSNIPIDISLKKIIDRSIHEL